MDSVLLAEAEFCKTVNSANRLSLWKKYTMPTCWLPRRDEDGINHASVVQAPHRGPSLPVDTVKHIPPGPHSPLGPMGPDGPSRPPCPGRPGSPMGPARPGSPSFPGGPGGPGLP